MKKCIKKLLLDEKIQTALSNIITKYTQAELHKYARKAVELATSLQTKAICRVDSENFISYLLYFFPRAYLANEVIFNSFSKRFADKECILILDIGCGMGAATLAVLSKLSTLASKKVVIYLNDVEKNILTETETLLRNIFNSANIEIYKIIGDANVLLEQNDNIKYDIILISYSLYDITKCNLWVAVEVVKQVMRLLNNGGIIIIVEPADRYKSTFLTMVRNFYKGYILAPCTHSFDCPLLKDEKWCYFKFMWDKPPFLLNIFYKLGCDLPEIKFSYIVLGNIKVNQSPMLGRIVTPVLSQKGRLLFKVCHDGKISHCMMLTRNIKANKIPFSSHTLIKFNNAIEADGFVKVEVDNFTIIDKD